MTTPQETIYRDPRTMDRDPNREGCQGHPGYGRHESVLWRLTEQFKADAQACAQAEGYVRQGQDGEEAAMNDWLNNVVAERVYGKANQVGRMGVSHLPDANASTAQPLPETSKGLPPLDFSRPDLGASIDLALSNINLWEILDPALKEGVTPQDFERHLESHPLQTLADLEKLEDKHFEATYQHEKALVRAEAVTKKGDKLSGTDDEVSHSTLTLGLKRLEKKENAKEAARAAFRRQRLAKLVVLIPSALLGPAPKASPQRRPDHAKSSHAPDPEGHVSKRALRDAERACKPDSS